MPANWNSPAYQWHLKAEAASNLGRFEDARSLALQALAAEPQFGLGCASLGRALCGLREYAEAEEQFRRALATDGDNSWFLHGLAACLIMRLNLTEALELADRLIELYPLAADGFILRGQILQEMLVPLEACEQFRTALSLAPRNVEAHGALGLSLLALRKYEESERHFREGLALEPNSAVLWNNIGVCFDQQGKLKDAALAYKAAIVADPNMKIAKQNTVSAVKRHLGLQSGTAIVLLFLMGRTLFFSWHFGGRESAIGILLLGVFVAALALLVKYSWIDVLIKKRQLRRADPQLLAMYQLLLRDKRK